MLLRHKPEEGNLTLDKEGYCPTTDLITAVAKKFKGFNLAQLEDIVKSEWERASKEVDSKSPFKYDEKVAKEVKDMLTKVAKEIDSVTDTNLLNAIWKATNEWLSPSETKEVLEWVFKDLKTTRLDN